MAARPIRLKPQQLQKLFRGLPPIAQLVIGVVLIIGVIGAYVQLPGLEAPEDTDNQTPAATPTPAASLEIAKVLADQQALYMVTKVVDGDTVRIEIDNRDWTVRMIGVDTPEVVDPRQAVQCFGREASSQVGQWLDSQLVRLELDDSQGYVDRYGRLLAYIRTADGQLINQRIIEEGFGFEYTYSRPYRYQAEFRQAQQLAEQAERGLWAATTCAGQRRTAE